MGGAKEEIKKLVNMVNCRQERNTLFRNRKIKRESRKKIKLLSLFDNLIAHFY